MLQRRISASLICLAALAWNSCGEPAATEKTAVGEIVASKPAQFAAKGECPGELRILDHPPTCKLLTGRVRFKKCTDATTGHDLGASGISCARAYELSAALGSASPIHSYGRSQQYLYRPTVVTYRPPFRVRPTGWTCWVEYEIHRLFAIQYVCWHGQSTIKFQFD